MKQVGETGHNTTRWEGRLKALGQLESASGLQEGGGLDRVIL